MIRKKWLKMVGFSRMFRQTSATGRVVVVDEGNIRDGSDLG